MPRRLVGIAEHISFLGKCPSSITGDGAVDRDLGTLPAISAIPSSGTAGACLELGPWDQYSMAELVLAFGPQQTLWIKVLSLDRQTLPGVRNLKTADNDQNKYSFPWSLFTSEGLSVYNRVLYLSLNVHKIS